MGRAGANAISNRWLTKARTVAHTPEKSRPLASKLKRIYTPRIISDHIMVAEDFERLHKFLLETEGLSEVSDDMRELIEQEWPELVHKLPPKGPLLVLISTPPPLMRTAPTIVPQTAADSMPTNTIAARRATESSSPSSST